MTRRWLAILTIGLLLTAAGVGLTTTVPAGADTGAPKTIQGTYADEVDLELVLAVDISLSMDEDEQRLQRAGYAAALTDPAVIRAIRSGGYGRIAVAYMEWAGVTAQSVIVDWHIIEDEASAVAFADTLLDQSIHRARRTSISGGLLAAMSLFERNDVRGLRRVIDISGDGPNNQGPPVTEARDRIVAEGITINGLPLLLKRGGFASFFDLEDLDRFYEDCVIGGFGAFVLPVRETSRFAEAIRQKLVLEIAGRTPAVVPAQVEAPAPPYDCLIGEKRWQEWMRRGYMTP